MRVATLIPAYRLKYFVNALNSALNQTVRPDLIIVSDDTPNAEIAELLDTQNVVKMLSAQDIKLEVIMGPRKKKAYWNWKCLLEAWNSQTDTAHFLFDDDCIFPTFYENHLRIIENNELMASVSRRWRGDKTGTIVGAFNIPDFIKNIDAKQMLIDPKSLFQSVVPQSSNWLGEFSNTLFHKTSLKELRTEDLDGLSFYGLGDIGFFLQIGQQGKLGFINEHLGFFRVHDNQNTGNVDKLDYLAANLAWIPIAVSSEKLGFINQIEKNVAITQILNLIFEIYKSSKYCDMIDRHFNKMINPESRSKYFSEEDFLNCWKRFIVLAKNLNSLNEI